MDAVIKVGGSLAEDPAALKALCKELGEAAKKHSLVVVPGGGKFADVVRAFDRRFALSSAVAHRMAVLAMDQYGLLLTQLIPNSRPIIALEEAQGLLRRRIVPVLLPSELMLQNEAFEPSWDVTSDSIAAYFASRLCAAKLILVTNVDGIFTKDPMKFKEAELFEEISIAELLSLGRNSVDRFLPKLLSETALDCYVVNGKRPERVAAVLDGRDTVCTHIAATKATR